MWYFLGVTMLVKVYQIIKSCSLWPSKVFRRGAQEFPTLGPKCWENPKWPPQILENGISRHISTCSCPRIYYCMSNYMLYFIFDIHLIIQIQNSTWPTKYKMATDEIIGNGRHVYMPMKLLKNYISRTNFKYFFQYKAVQDCLRIILIWHLY